MFRHSRFAVALFAFITSTLLAGCGSGVVPSSGTATDVPIATLNTSSQISFGTVAVGQTGTAQSITLTNSGKATLVISGVVLNDTTNFSMANSCGASLAAGASCQIAANFKPSTAATFSSTIVITDNSNNVSGSTQTITLTGIGGSTTSTAPVAELSATTPLDFGSVSAGSTGTAQSFTLSNTGNATLNIASIVLSDTTNFTWTNACGATLAAGANCQITANFKPSSTGTYTATITITDNSYNITGSTQTVALNGAGTAAIVPQATLSPTALTFPDTDAGVTSSPLTATLTNSGNGPLTISNIASTNTANFTVTNTCGATLAAGASCTLSITFTPTTSGTSYTGSVVITDNAGNVTGATQTLSLGGKGTTATGAVLTLTPSSLTFPATNVGSSSTPQTLTLTNTSSTASVNISSIAVTGGATASSFSQTNTCGTTLAANASCTISVTFSPTIAGTFLAYVTVTDTATNSPQTATLNATGAAATLALSSNALNFTSTKIGTTATLSTTLSNTGAATANLSSITLAGSSNYVKSTTCGTTLAGGASCTLSVAYTPTSTSTDTGTITITSSNATNSPLTVSITGSGTNAAVTYNLYELPDPGTGQPGAGLLTAVYGLIDNAQSTLDMTMYALNDATTLSKLVSACGRGVKVRAVLDQNSEKSQNATSYSTLNSTTNCAAVWANKAFSVTHEKSLVVDNSKMALMSLNLQSAYYSTTRDFAMVYNDPADIAAVEATFNMDYAAGTPSSGVAGASDFSYSPVRAPTSSGARPPRSRRCSTSSTTPPRRWSLKRKSSRTPPVTSPAP
ncbi:choice-of-anchor D domain-containing protein [Granulicella cerasi]|uniref:Choice-of-anchor D domain-containing protein n=1 Tax=Granulicella cerasi TaxID=741063 RepID=A0ABW1ZE48_9BACT